MPRAFARSAMVDQVVAQLVDRQAAKRVVAAERDDQNLHVPVERPVDPPQARRLTCRRTPRR